MCEQRLRVSEHMCARVCVGVCVWVSVCVGVRVCLHVFCAEWLHECWVGSAATKEEWTYTVAYTG